MEKIENTSPILEIIKVFGEDGTAHKDLKDLKESIDSLVNTLEKRSGKKETDDKETSNSEDNPDNDTKEKNILENLKDFGKGFLQGAFGIKSNISSSKGIKTENIDTKNLDKNKVLSDMVDVLKLMSEDTTQLKIYEEISEIKKIISNINDSKSKTIKPNTEESKQEDREKLAEAIARRLSEISGIGGNTGLDIPSRNNAPSGTSKKIIPPLALASSVIGATTAIGLVASYGATNALSNATDEQLGQLQNDIGSDTGMAAATLLAARNNNESPPGRSPQVDARRVDNAIEAKTTERIRQIDASLNNIDPNLQANKAYIDKLKAEKAQLIGSTKKLPQNNMVTTHSPEAIEEERQAIEATKKLKQKSNASITPKLKDDMTWRITDEEIKKPLLELKQIQNQDTYIPPGPDITTGNKIDTSKTLNDMTNMNSELKNEVTNNEPISITSNQFNDNKNTAFEGAKITPYPNYKAFDKWQDSRSGGYDHV